MLMSKLTYNEDQKLLTVSYALDVLNSEWFGGLFPDKSDNLYIPLLMLTAYKRTPHLLSMKEAAAAMGVSHSRPLHRYVDRAIAQGFFEKTDSPDKRKVLLKPTEKLFELCREEAARQREGVLRFVTGLILAGPLPDTGAANLKIKTKPDRIPELEDFYRRLANSGFRILPSP